MSRQCDGNRCVSLGEPYPGLGKLVDVWSLDGCVSVAPKMISAKSINGDEDNIGGWFYGCPGMKTKQQEYEGCEEGSGG